MNNLAKSPSQAALMQPSFAKGPRSLRGITITPIMGTLMERRDRTGACFLSAVASID